MDLQTKIEFIIEMAVREILEQTGTIGHNKQTIGTLNTDHKSDLRLLFDAELSKQCGDINFGQYNELKKQHQLI